MLYRSDPAAALRDYSTVIEVVEAGRARFGFVADAEVAREIALASRANEKANDGLYEQAHEDCQRLIEAERNARFQLGKRWPLASHLGLANSLDVVAKRLREKFPEMALALWELRLEIQNATSDRVETLKSLLALGLEYLKSESREKASSYLGRGVSQFARIIDEWSDEDGTPHAKADLINTMNYYVSRSFEHAARLELLDLTRAEQWQRECLRLLEDEDNLAARDRMQLWGAARSTHGSILCNLASSSGDRSWAVRAQEVLAEALVFFEERDELQAVVQIHDEIRAARIAAAS
jgi:phage baseplate assembly protein W